MGVSKRSTVFDGRRGNSSGAAPTLRDVLSHLSPRAAERALGAGGKKLLAEARRYEIDLGQQVRFDGRKLRLRVDGATATLRLADDAPGRLARTCDRCSRPCVHVAAALQTVLEEKVALGLAAPPEERAPEGLRSDAELVADALELRAERARSERMRVRAADPKDPWTSYQLTSGESGRSYRVELRGLERGASFCTCPDFRKNTLGTCKHILHVEDKVRRKFSGSRLAQPYRRRKASLGVGYGEELSLRLLLPDDCRGEVADLGKVFGETAVEATPIRRLLRAVRQIESLGHDVLIYPDAEELIENVMLRDRLARHAAEIRQNPGKHALRKELLKVELLPYQLDGIAFAAGAGRAILADDMGLGKTIQAIGTAELLAREANVRRVLVVCPASVKSQWVSEIGRFSERSARVVVGASARRVEQYAGTQFFTVCNYEQVLRDLAAIEAVPWDLIVLDEAQRIKNWEAKTTQVVKALRSPFALALTGTPLENRIDELFSIVEFIDDRRLGPAFKFFHQHRIVNQDGRVAGFRNLDSLRETLAPVLLRRTRAEVVRQLPERTTEVLRVTPTEEQLALHNSQMRVVQSIVQKNWISEVDLLRLQKALLLCRMAADSSYLVDKQRPAYSTKLERLAELFDELLAEGDRKVIVFSEWTTMLDEIETVLRPRLAAAGVASVRLEGKVPQQKRKELVRRFQEDDDCVVFLTTNAGATGLNLQAANTVVNVDLPWNPALLEQRIGRAHRMGQKRKVQVYLMVSADTIEENMLGTLAAKHELFQAVLDPDSTIDEVELQTGMEGLKQRLEVLLGTKPEAPVDASEEQRVVADQQRLQQERTRVAEAGGRMLAAAFEFLGEMLPASAGREGAAGSSDPMTTALREQLGRCVEEDEQGRPRLTVTLPGREALDRLAESLGRLLVGR